MKKYHPGKPVNIHLQLLINIIQENNWIITTKNGKGKLPLFNGEGERVITVYSYLDLLIRIEGGIHGN